LIRLGQLGDLEKITYLATKVRKNMIDSGLNQWLGKYPNYDNFYQDLIKQGLFVYILDNEIVASMSLLIENDPPYKVLKWESDNALVIHRILVDPQYQKQGIGKSMINYASEYGKNKNYTAIKIDTHPDNIKMQNMLKSLGFVYRGYLESINRLAYELLI
jgi:ribosomal protein S18 acetylase RimI-like enzyme